MAMVYISCAYQKMPQHDTEMYCEDWPPSMHGRARVEQFWRLPAPSSSSRGFFRNIDKKQNLRPRNVDIGSIFDVF